MTDQSYKTYRGYDFRDQVMSYIKQGNRSSKRTIRVVLEGKLVKKFQYKAFDVISKARAVRKCEKFVDNLMDQPTP